MHSRQILSSGWSTARHNRSAHPKAMHVRAATKPSSRLVAGLHAAQLLNPPLTVVKQYIFPSTATGASTIQSSGAACCQPQPRTQYCRISGIAGFCDFPAVVTARCRGQCGQHLLATMLGLHSQSAAPTARMHAQRPARLSNRKMRPNPSRGSQLATHASSGQDLYMGLDFGTSGARATVIDDVGQIINDLKQGYSPASAKDWAATWNEMLFELIKGLPADQLQHVRSIAIDGTSATAMLVDAATGKVLAPVKLYNEAQGPAAVEAARAMAPPAHTATASTSTLCKLLTWNLEGTWQAAAADGAQPVLLHQADWLASLLHGQRGVTDWNNALKLGFDPGAESYPDWLLKQEFAHLLPRRVVAPGAPVAPVTPAVTQQTQLSRDCWVCGGTTDSIAAFVAADVQEVGWAVTSLGSTLAVKLLSQHRVDDAAYGVYGHRLGDTWLVGGASNTGGVVLRQYFSNEQLQQLTERIDITKPTGLDYYPLVKPGERFPVNDPHLQPRLEPRPADDALFLQGLLESMSRIEAEAYQLLARLGASPVQRVLTAGGGAVNQQWTRLREAAIGVPVAPSQHGEASYGAACLARSGWRKRQQQSGGAGSAAS